MGDGVVGVLEKDEVEQAGAVFEGDEDDPLPGGDRRGLGGGADPGDQDPLARAHGLQVSGIGRADLAQEAVVVLHQVLADVDGQSLQLGGHAVAAGHLRQAAGTCGDQFPAQRQLAFRRGAVAGVPVQLGGLQQQVAPRRLPRQRPERADADQALGQRQGRAGALPQILQPGVGLAGRQAPHFILGGSLDRGQGQAHTPAVGGLLHAVPGAGGVDVHRQDRYAVAAGVGDDHPARPHPRVVLQQSRVQRGRVVPLEPGRLHRGHSERHRVGSTKSFSELRLLGT